MFVVCRVKQMHSKASALSKNVVRRKGTLRPAVNSLPTQGLKRDEARQGRCRYPPEVPPTGDARQVVRKPSTRP